MGKDFTMVHDPVVGTLIDAIQKDETLTIENFPSYAAHSHHYFSICIHNYVHDKKKFYLDKFDQLPGFVVGCQNAKKVVNILFEINGSLSNTPASSLDDSDSKER